MNESSKAAIAQQLSIFESGEGEHVIDFETGTRIGREAAAAAILEYLFENPDSVTTRPGIAGAS